MKKSTTRPAASNKPKARSATVTKSKALISTAKRSNALTATAKKSNTSIATAKRSKTRTAPSTTPKARTAKARPSNSALERYRAMRDFGATTEPSGDDARSSSSVDSASNNRASADASSTPALSFVIQEHHARRLHYDFRLELDGVLKSWAVPKSPDMQPGERRLAVHVEDHPLEYGRFEGTIPQGHYGAGTVEVWDRGTWHPQGDPHEGYARGKLHFTLDGARLRGDWVLVRTRMDTNAKQESWLLMRHSARATDAGRATSARAKRTRDIAADASAQPRSTIDVRRIAALPTLTPAQRRKVLAALPGARIAELPDQLDAQLATLVDAAPSDAHDDWHYELKLDGYRLLTRIERKRARLITRNHHDWTRKLPEQRAALEALGLDGTWLDGEIVVLDDDGVPSFQRLQNAFSAASTRGIVYFVFDLPFCAGVDLRGCTLDVRRGVLRALLADTDDALVRFSPHFDATPARMLSSACRVNIEGLIGKRADSTYAAGRSTTWIKLKCRQRQEFVVVGYTDPDGARLHLGALLLAVRDENGLRYAGRVGSGFDAASLKTTIRRLRALHADDARIRLPKGVSARGVHWIDPQLVAEVSFAQWTHDQLVRQAVFHGLRDDKPARDVVRERAVSSRTVEEQVIAKRATAKRAASSRATPSGTTTVSAATSSVGDVKITHPDRVIDPASTTTKRDLVAYFARIAPMVLPHLQERPVSIVRAPDVIDGELFFQKHANRLEIAHVRLLDRKLDPGHAPLMAIDRADALIGAAQMNTVELHTWNGLARLPSVPDRFVLDLDPDPALPWARMRDAAQLVKSLLDELGLTAFLKTSGGKGLHVVVPLSGRDDWEAVHRFSQAIAEHLAKNLPERFSAKMGPRNRVGKIFVDHLRNRRGATTVSAFSPRARPNLPVSVPIHWDELKALDSASRWTIANVDQRLRDLDGADPWDGYARVRQTIERARQSIGDA